MRFNPIRSFKNPTTRPRAIMWSGVALIIFIVLVVVGLDGTSTYWFCTTPCHIVHDDNTVAYQASSHTNVACVACHEPVDASPLVLTMKKIEVIPDVFTTLAGTFELPVNHDNHVALEMPSEQCTQCHDLEYRKVSTQKGLIIDHDIHAENDVQCTICHNRVAHRDDLATLVLEGGAKHDNWTDMDACFRCHSQAKEAKAPGKCAACHTKSFDLEPETHDAKDWYVEWGDSSGHAEAAKAESESIAASVEFYKERAPDEPSHGEIEGKEPTGELKPASQINSCYTCHATSFCDSCHQTQIPHTAEFKTNHVEEAYAEPQVCAKCHASSPEAAKNTEAVCNACHHPTSTGPGATWRSEHKTTVQSGGAEDCYRCHKQEYCEACHVAWSMGAPLPEEER